MDIVAFSVAQGMHEHISYMDDRLVDEIWKDLGGRVERVRIHGVAREVEREFGDATVTTFIRIFIRRRTRECLTVEMK